MKVEFDFAADAREPAQVRRRTTRIMAALDLTESTAGRSRTWRQVYPHRRMRDLPPVGAEIDAHVSVSPGHGSGVVDVAVGLRKPLVSASHSFPIATAVDTQLAIRTKCSPSLLMGTT